MKKFLMSLISIFITIITVGAMYLFTVKLGNKSNLTKSKFSENKVIEDKKDIDVKDESDNSKKNNKDEKYIKPNSDKSNEEETIRKAQSNKGRLKSNKENEVNKTEEQKDISVFKVNKHTLLQNLPMKDKVKLLYMCKGLSTIDMGNIKQYMKSSKELEASSEIFKILRQRLSKENYDEIKKILNPYVNIEYIESNI